MAYPCQDISGAPYEYYIVSRNSSSSQTKSEFLLVGCEDDTTITITPTQTVSIPKDTQSSSSTLTSIFSGVSKQITLNKMQTLLIGKSSTDLTGSRIVSNKPLTVISGHECGNVLSGSPCEHLTEQIPPSTTWGRKFLLVPFGGRNNGQYYKVVSSRQTQRLYAHAILCLQQRRSLLQAVPSHFSPAQTHTVLWCPTNHYLSLN